MKLVNVKYFFRNEITKKRGKLILRFIRSKTASTYKYLFSPIQELVSIRFRHTSKRVFVVVAAAFLDIIAFRGFESLRMKNNLCET